MQPARTVAERRQLLNGTDTARSSISIAACALPLCLTALLCTLDVGGVDTGDCSLSKPSSVLLSPLGPAGVLVRTAEIRAASPSVAALVVVDATDMGDAAPARLAAASSICTAEDRMRAHHKSRGCGLLYAVCC